MAPKRKTESEGAATPAAGTGAGRRVTRSMGQTGVQASTAPVKSGKEKPAKKPVKKTEKAGKEENGVSVGEKRTQTVSGDDAVPKKSKSRKVDAAAAASRTIVIEHCKQCNSFKTRALQVKEGLEKGVPDITVLVNPDKPRRGCFEIREKDGEKFISLLELKRPFKPMKDLNMEEVIADIVEKITAA